MILWIHDFYVFALTPIETKYRLSHIDFKTGLFMSFSPVILSLRRGPCASEGSAVGVHVEFF